MLGRQNREQLEFVVCGSLRELVPDDHVLARVDRVLDLSWLEDEVGDLYASGVGRPGIDPEAAVRLMLAGFLLGIVQDRRLMREAQANLAIRWFAGFGLNDRLPDHSSLTRIRQRWGSQKFRRIFQRIVGACAEAGVATGEVAHVDATLIRADVSFDALADRHLDTLEAETLTQEDRQARRTGKFKKVCTTDPDATMATTSQKQRLQPAYKQHTSVDDSSGVVLDIDVVTGEAPDFKRLDERLDTLEETLGHRPATVTADAAYGTGAVYTALDQRGIEGIIPHRPPVRRGDAKGFPVERFRYDALHDVVRCPRKKVLTPRSATQTGRWFRAEARTCRACPLRDQCIGENAASRRVHITDTYLAVLRARRRRRAWDARDRRLYVRHRWRVEGAHGTAKVLHGLARAVRRGLDNMKIQALLTAIAMNLKVLSREFMRLLVMFLTALRAARQRQPPRVRLLIPHRPLAQHRPRQRQWQT